MHDVNGEGVNDTLQQIVGFSKRVQVQPRTLASNWSGLDMGFYMNKALALDVLRTILTTESIQGRSHAPRWQQPLLLCLQAERPQGEPYG